MPRFKAGDRVRIKFDAKAPDWVRKFEKEEHIISWIDPRHATSFWAGIRIMPVVPSGEFPEGFCICEDEIVEVISGGEYLEL